MATPSGARIQGQGDILLRQIDPHWLDGEDPSSQNFRPFRDIDEGMLSVDQRAKTSYEASFKLYTDPKPTGFERPSHGIWGLSIAEVEAEKLSACDDPVAEDKQNRTPANPAHAVIQFGDAEEKSWRKIGKALKKKAVERGRLFPAAGAAAAGVPL